jgi:hypothetical protein
VNQGLHQAAFSLGQFRAVAGIDGDVAECCGAVVLDVDIGGRKELDEDGNSTGVDELLAVVIWKSVSPLPLCTVPRQSRT